MSSGPPGVVLGRSRSRGVENLCGQLVRDVPILGHFSSVHGGYRDVPNVEQELQSTSRLLNMMKM